MPVDKGGLMYCIFSTHVQETEYNGGLSYESSMATTITPILHVTSVKNHTGFKVSKSHDVFKLQRASAPYLEKKCRVLCNVHCNAAGVERASHRAEA